MEGVLSACQDRTWHRVLNKYLLNELFSLFWLQSLMVNFMLNQHPCGRARKEKQWSLLPFRAIAAMFPHFSTWYPKRRKAFLGLVLSSLNCFHSLRTGKNTKVYFLKSTKKKKFKKAVYISFLLAIFKISCCQKAKVIHTLQHWFLTVFESFHLKIWRKVIFISPEICVCVYIYIYIYI